MSRILITGCNGQLGYELTRLFAEECVPLSRQQLDLSNPELIVEVVESIKPQIIINCAAYTAVDAAESDVEAVRVINTASVSSMVGAAARTHSHFVQISTDYVFDSSLKRQPHVEADVAEPIGVYARSKRDAEMVVQSYERGLVIRTCGLYGHAPIAKNFVSTMLRIGASRREVRVVDDQICQPTSTLALSEAIRKLVDVRATGIVHATSSGETTWCGFARVIFDLWRVDCQVIPITTAEYNAAAPRPSYSVLDCSKLLTMCGHRMPSIEDALQQYKLESPASYKLDAPASESRD